MNRGPFQTFYELVMLLSSLFLLDDHLIFFVRSILFGLVTITLVYKKDRHQK